MTTIYKEITMVARVLIEKINCISNIIEGVQRMTISNGIHYLFMAVFTQYAYETNISLLSYLSKILNQQIQLKIII